MEETQQMIQGCPVKTPHCYISPNYTLDLTVKAKLLYAFVAFLYRTSVNQTDSLSSLKMLLYSGVQMKRFQTHSGTAET